MSTWYPTHFLSLLGYVSKCDHFSCLSKQMKSEFNQKVLKTTQWRINKVEKVNQKIDTIYIPTWSRKLQESWARRIFQEWSSGTADPIWSLVPGPPYVICGKETNNKHAKTSKFQLLTMQVILCLVRDLLLLKHIK